MMKRWTILLLALAVFTGCVYDKYMPEECAYSDDVIYHLAFVLNSPAALSSDDTKASDDGLETSQIGSEILVKRVDLFFYTGGGLPHIATRTYPNSTTDVPLGTYYNLVRGYTYEWIAQGIEGMTWMKE